MDIDLLSRILLSLMFGVSAYKTLSSGFEGSINYVKSVNWPMPELSVYLSFGLKLFVVYSLIMNKYLEYSIPLIILFLLIVMYLFNNPIKNPEKIWMFLSLCGFIGGLLLLYPNK
tara:strand:- start:494 stop:838 length:345 start_codon:yes stop_codon:yes gene_type:complete